MENSKAYNYLLEQINATGSKKLDGYYPRIMEEIHEWERDEVEEIIWNTFHKNNDTDLAPFLPKLNKYNGIAALKEALDKCNIPSDNSLNIAKTLLDYTNDIQYLEVFRKNIDTTNWSNNLITFSTINSCKPDNYIFEFLKEMYMKCDDSLVLNVIVTGLLHCKGYILNPFSIQESINKRKLRKKFLIEDIGNRKENIDKLERGEI